MGKCSRNLVSNTVNVDNDLMLDGRQTFIWTTNDRELKKITYSI